MNEKTYGPRTSIREIPVANDKIYKEVALHIKADPTEVRQMVESVGEFIAHTIRKGQMEGVMIAGFGKFQPKKRKIQTIHKVQVNRRTGMDLLYRAVKGKPVIDHRPKPDTDETI